MQHKVILSLGSNLGNRENYLQEAIFEINNRVGTVISVSKVYETPSWGFDSHHFLNAAILVHSYFEPEIILSEILQIEKELGRNRENLDGYQARTIDIDIIAYDDSIIKTADLVIPHPQLAHRKFVLMPFADIYPDWTYPKSQIGLKDLIENTSDTSTLAAVGKLDNPIEKYKSKFGLYTVIEGNIGSGKTSLVKKISEDFGLVSVLESFEDNPFIADFYQNPDYHAFALEMYFLLERIEQLRVLNDSDKYISDYHLEKCLLFAQQTLSSSEYNLFLKTFNNLSINTKKIDTYIYLDQPIDKLLQQIKKRNRSFETNISPDYLEKIAQAYGQQFEQIDVQNKKRVDMSQLDFKKNPADYLTILATIFD